MTTKNCKDCTHCEDCQKDPEHDMSFAIECPDFNPSEEKTTTKKNYLWIIFVLAIMAGVVWYLLPDQGPLDILKKPKVAGFTIETDTWHASDQERTEYFTCWIIQNGSVRANDVLVWAESLGNYDFRETYNWIDPDEYVSFSGRTYGRDEEWGVVSLRWHYFDENNNTVSCEGYIFFGRLGIEDSSIQVEVK